MDLDLVGEKEIAGRLQVQPGTVHQWRKRGVLPPPAAVVSGVPVWRWETVEGWASTTGRLSGPTRAFSPPALLAGSAPEVLDRISRSPLARAFYLAGGTGLALQLGHRVSRDLDFFSLQATESVPTRRVLDQLGRIFLPAEYTVRLRERGQIDVAIKGVKVSFVAYPFSLEEAPVKQGPMKIAAARDIAAMKAFAIGRRAVSRDYVDLYYSLSRAMISMDDLCSKAERIFALEDGPVFDAWLFIKQLTYTDDLDDWRTVMDDVLDRELTWDAVREYLAEASVTWARAHVIGDGRDESEL